MCIRFDTTVLQMYLRLNDLFFMTNRKPPWSSPKEYCMYNESKAPNPWKQPVPLACDLKKRCIPHSSISHSVTGIDRWIRWYHGVCDISKDAVHEYPLYGRPLCSEDWVVGWLRPPPAFAACSPYRRGRRSSRFRRPSLVWVLVTRSAWMAYCWFWLWIER